MTTTNVVRAGLGTPHKVMIAGFATIAVLVWVVVQAFLYRAVDPIALVIGGVALMAAGLVATGWRWAVVTATVLAALLFLFDVPVLLGRLAEPGALGWFAVSLLALVSYLAILGAGALAIARGRRSA